MREGPIQKNVVAYARKKGFWARKFVSQHRRSAPDFIFGWDRQIWFIEFKATGEQPTELQAKEHKEMRDVGLTVYVVDDIDTGRAIIDSYA
jgi:hypothetical protein